MRLHLCAHTKSTEQLCTRLTRTTPPLVFSLPPPPPPPTPPAPHLPALGVHLQHPQRDPERGGGRAAGDEGEARGRHVVLRQGVRPHRSLLGGQLRREWAGLGATPEAVGGQEHYCRKQMTVSYASPRGHFCKPTPMTPKAAGGNNVAKLFRNYLGECGN